MPFHQEVGGTAARYFIFVEFNRGGVVHIFVSSTELARGVGLVWDVLRGWTIDE